VVDRVSSVEKLVKVGTLRLLAVRGALANSIQWIKNFLADYDGKLVVFAVHKEIISALMEEFGDIAVKIDGSVPTGEVRQTIVEKFQNDKNIRLFVGNIKAAGVGITLTASSNIVFLELPWTPGELEQAEDRCHRMGQKNAVNIWYLLAENTIEMELAKMIDSKRNILSQVLDGQVISEEDTLSSLLGLYEGKGL
jgi:SNF2 family DNA or RNA helicase